MKYPNIVSVRSVVETASQVSARVPPGMAWVPARPCGYPTFWHRCRAALLVFTGKADALVWDGEQ